MFANSPDIWVIMGARKKGKYQNNLSNSYTMVYPPAQGDDPQALASGLSLVQVDKSWFYIALIGVALLGMKYFMLKFAISCKGGITFGY